MQSRLGCLALLCLVLLPGPLAPQVWGFPGQLKLQLSDWGPDHAGLRCRAQTPTQIEQNMPLDISFELQCIPNALKAGVKNLNTFLPAQHVELMLTHVKTGKAFTVRPYDPARGMRAIDTGKHADRLDRTPLKPWLIRFPLVGLGDALEPGSYECRARYSFSENQLGFWFGTVDSGGFRLEVRKETPHTQTYLLPRRLRLTKGLQVGFGKEDAEAITFPARNGHFVGTQVTVGKTGYRLTGGVPVPDDVNPLDQWLDYMKGDRTISYTIEIFETADPPVHMWHPEPGARGYRVLWRRTFTLTLTEAEIRQVGR